VCHGPYKCGVDILLDWFEEVVVGSRQQICLNCRVTAVVHPPNLGLIKESFGIMSQPNCLLMKTGLAEWASQSTRQEVTN
jgi:hypothetical protein